MPTIDILLDILIVAQLAIETSGQVLATVTEADQERELRRFTPAVRFAEGLPADAITESIKQTVAYKREPVLLAFIFDMLRRTGLSEFPDEKSKYPFLAALNLVNCIATARRIAVLSNQAEPSCAEKAALQLGSELGRVLGDIFCSVFRAVRRRRWCWSR